MTTRKADMRPRRVATCHPERKHEAKGLCKQCYGAAYHIGYYATHRRERLAYSKVYDAKHRDYYANHKEERLAYNRVYNTRLKLEAFNAYGGPRCVCCGETLVEGLSLDHIAGDGATRRRQPGPKSTIYLRLRQQGYPPGFQVLCFTCNFAKGTGDHCPHWDVVATP